MKLASQFSYRLLSSALAVAMSVSLVACGGEKKASESAEQAEPAKTETSTEAKPAEGSAEKKDANATEGSETKDANAAEATAGDVIRIATEGAYPPMSYTNADGSLSGFDIDVMNALCEQMKANCEITAQEWDGIIPGLRAKKYDAIIAGMSITAERQKVIDFTEPYFSSGLMVIAKGDADISLDNAKTVGVQRSTVASEYMAEKYPNVQAKLYDTQENVNLDLVSGRVDAILVDQVVGTDWLSKDEAKDFKRKGQVIATGKDDMGIAVRKGDALSGKFNTALAEIKGNGTYQKITQKYFNK